MKFRKLERTRRTHPKYTLHQLRRVQVHVPRKGTVGIGRIRRLLGIELGAGQQTDSTEVIVQPGIADTACGYAFAALPAT
jgi:hypothetical protein